MPVPIKTVASAPAYSHSKPLASPKRNDVTETTQNSVPSKNVEVEIEVAVGSIVVHKVFGEGTVSQLDKVMKHIRVAFAKDEKTFIFPDAFKQGFLRVKV